MGCQLLATAKKTLMNVDGGNEITYHPFMITRADLEVDQSSEFEL